MARITERGTQLKIAITCVVNSFGFGLTIAYEKPSVAYLLHHGILHCFVSVVHKFLDSLEFGSHFILSPGRDHCSINILTREMMNTIAQELLCTDGDFFVPFGQTIIMAKWEEKVYSHCQKRKF